MKSAIVVLLTALFLFGCPKREIARFPVVETAPPSYIWVCNTHADGTTVCDAVPTLKDVPSGYECVYQSNGITACWPNKMTLPREQR